LIMTVGLSTVLSQYLRGSSIYTLKLVKRGIPLERDRDVDVMRGLSVSEVMTQDPDVVRADMSLQGLADTFTRTRHHGFPVLDTHGNFAGVVTIQDLERAMTHDSVSGLAVNDIVRQDCVTVYPDDSLSKALRLMSERGFGRVPVVSRENPERLVGLLRRGDIIRAYRYAVLRKLESQHRKESVRLGRMTDTEILEIPLAPGMAAVGRRIRDLHLPQQALITTIRRGEDVFIAHGETLLQPGDTVVILTKRKAVNELRTTLMTKE
jgi:CIC family chloride channel protein